MRIWRHTFQAEGNKVLIYSPDTDVYNIDLPLLSSISNKQVIVQLNVPHSPTHSYLHLSNLITALELDPDLASLPRSSLCNIFQLLFICSGCDYVSYFHGHGKVAFLNTFFQHAPFITGEHADGLLSDTGEDVKERGFLSSLRLIGTLYSKKHISAMASLKNVETPQQLYNSITEASIKEKHVAWYNTISSIVCERISDKRDRVPSHTSMWRHWLRCCWVGMMWNNATQQDLNEDLPEPESSGWIKKSDGCFDFDWECDEDHQSVQKTINFLTKGCSCKTGCGNQRCGCVKNGRKCGPSCNCHNCQNVLPSDEVPSTSGFTSGTVAPYESEDSDITDSYSDESTTSETIETETISNVYDEDNDMYL